MGGRERVFCVRLATGRNDGVENQLGAILYRPIRIGPDVKCVPGIFSGGVALITHLSSSAKVEYRYSYSSTPSVAVWHATG